MTAQALEALAVANDVRLNRAAIKREIGRMDMRDGRAQVARIITAPDGLWSGARLDYVLQIPAFCGPAFSGRVRRKASATGTPIHPDRRLGELTERERLAIAGLLERRAR